MDVKGSANGLGRIAQEALAWSGARGRAHVGKLGSGGRVFRTLVRNMVGRDRSAPAMF
jgi:hypothetical protein